MTAPGHDPATRDGSATDWHALDTAACLGAAAAQMSGLHAMDAARGGRCHRASAHSWRARGRCSFGLGRVAAIVMQRKTARPVQFGITQHTRDAVSAWVAAARLGRDQHLFPGRIASSSHLSTRQYARIVRRWVASIGLEPMTYGTPTMRRTKATVIYRRTRNIGAVQLLLGHIKLESTVRYLGIEVNDALEVSEQTDA